MASKKPSRDRLMGGYAVTATGCWEWQGSRTPKGYGQIHDRRTRFAHRVSYELHVGEIPPGWCVCHRCDNPPCINPAHLFVGSNRDNRADMQAKGRSCAPKRPAAGERNGFSKVTAEQVRQIRELAAFGGLTNVQLGRNFGITGAQIGNIVKRKSWVSA